MQYSIKKIKNSENVILELHVPKSKVKELSKNDISICDLLETVIKVLDADLINQIYNKDNVPHKKIQTGTNIIQGEF